MHAVWTVTQDKHAHTEYDSIISSLFMLVSVLARCLLIPFWPPCIQHAQPTTHVINLSSTERKIQLNIHPITCHEGTGGEKRYGSALSLTLALYEVGSLTPHPGHFTPGTFPDTHCAGGRVESRVGLDGRRKSRPQRDSIAWTA